MNKERIFLKQSLYDLDDEGNLILILKDGHVTDLKFMSDLKGVEYFSFWYRTYDGINDFSGIKYYGVCTLEEDIGIAYDVDNKAIIDVINRICIEANSFHTPIL